MSRVSRTIDRVGVTFDDETYVTGRGRHRRHLRLVVRRSRFTETTQQRLWPEWRHHAFITNVELDTVEGLDAQDARRSLVAGRAPLPVYFPDLGLRMERVTGIEPA